MSIQIGRRYLTKAGRLVHVTEFRYDKLGLKAACWNAKGDLTIGGFHGWLHTKHLRPQR